MGHEMEHRRSPPQCAQREHHETEVGNGGIRQDSLQIGGHESDGGRSQGSDYAHAGDDHECFGGGSEDRERTRDEIYTSDDHGGSVDQRADRSGTFHGIRKPNVERELSRLAHGSEEQEDGYGRSGSVAQCAGVYGGKSVGHAEAADIEPQ